MRKIRIWIAINIFLLALHIPSPQASIGQPIPTPPPFSQEEELDEQTEENPFDSSQGEIFPPMLPPNEVPQQFPHAEPVTLPPMDPNEPAAYPQETVKPKYPVAKKIGTVPKKKGDCSGSFLVGQRVVTSKYAGWGWIKPPHGHWSSARWVMLKETPGQIHIPSRYTGDLRTDNGIRYKLYGEFAPYLGYEPNIDVYVPVFILRGFELVGRGEPIRRSLPVSMGLSGPSRFSERGANVRRALHP